MNRLKQAIFIGIMLCLIPISARASALAKLELESQIQQKFLNVIRPLDSRVQVIVNVTLVKIDTNLPGVGLNVNGFTQSANDIEWDDIKSVNVVVQSSLNPFPSSLETTLRQQLLNGLKNVSVQIQKTPEDQLALNEKPKPEQESMLHQITPLVDRLSNQVDHLISFLMIVSILAVGVYAGFGLWARFASRTQFKTGVDSLGSVLSNLNRAADDEGAAPSRRVQAPAAESFARARGTESGGDNRQSAIRELSAESLVALLSDCYWSELEGYAQFLWSSMSFESRAQVVKLWSPATAYASFFAKSESVNLGYHNHPYYLNPALHCEELSNEAIATWVRQNKAAWHQLSPIRKAHANFALSERIEFSKAQARDGIALPPQKTMPRKLFSDLQIRKVGVEDERLILKNPASMIDHLGQINSLVWLKLLNNPEITSVLSRYSAQDLADAWVGPAEYLTSLEAFMPEKKVQRLRELVAKNKPSRDSDIMRDIITQIEAQLKASGTEGHDDSDQAKAA